MRLTYPFSGKSIRVWFILGIVLLQFLSANPLWAGLKIYYIRHAQGGHNVVDEWKKKPRETWPAYVGNGDVFTPLGEEQVTAATVKLSTYHFDFIAVSPFWRTRHTVLPYLQKSKQKAEIWPELGEIGGGLSSPAFAPEELPPPTPNLFAMGKPITLSSEEELVFMVPEEKPTILPLKLGKDPRQQESNRKAIAQRIIQRIKQRFGGSDKSILLVGHGTSGGNLVRALLGYPAIQLDWINNTGLWMVEEQPDGSFRLQLFNDKPYTSPK